MEYTSNAIMYDEELAGPNGCDFILYPDETRTKAEVAAAKAELRRERDVVSIRIAGDEDRDELYRRAIFSHPATKGLKWYQIDDDRKLIRAHRKAGISHEAYININVLPFIKETEAKNLKEFGDNIYHI